VLEKRAAKQLYGDETEQLSREPQLMLRFAQMGNTFKTLSGHIARRRSSNTSNTLNNAAAANVTQHAFGELQSGEEVTAYTITAGVFEFTVIDWGARLTSAVVPDSKGEAEELTLQYSSIGEMEEKSPYYGCTVGRVCNRTARGTFELNGQIYDQLAINNGPNHLHGGIKGFDKQVWEAAPFVEKGSAGVRFDLASSDGEEGYPGMLGVTVTYRYGLSSRRKLFMCVKHYQGKQNTD
jgi:aldose 1-epimerase